MRAVVLAVTVDISLQLLVGYPRVLAARGWEVHIVSSPGPKLGPFAAAEGVFEHPIPMRRDPSPVRDLVSLVRWVRLLRRIRPDAVSVGTPKAALLGLVAARICGVPVRQYIVRGLRLSSAQGLMRRILVAVEKAAVRSATDVVAISESLRAEMIAIGIARPDQVAVVGYGSSNGVDTRAFDATRFTEAELLSRRRELNLAEGVPVVGFVGRLARDKGIDLIERALSELDRRGVRCQLLVVGAVDDEAGRRWLDGLGSRHVHYAYTGHVDDPALYISMMDVLCMPSIREGFGNAAVEASACGVPVVATAVTGLVDAVSDGETGLLSPSGDAVALADNLARLLSDDALARRLGSHGRARVLARFPREIVQANYAMRLDDLASAAGRR